MKKYKVVLQEGHKANPDQVIDGCLGNIFNNGKVALYERGEAIKKARMFGGYTKQVEGLHSVITKLSVVSIPENALLHGVVKLLEGREAFKDTDDTLDEKMYAGHIFEDIAGEQAELEDGHMFKAQQKVLDQLDELAELIGEDYVLITKA